MSGIERESERASEGGSERPTIEDVAREAGVSRQTVSNVVNAPERVSDSTRTETEAAIERLGYRSNAIARNLRQRASRLIGYRVPAAQRGAIHPVLDGFLHALTVAARAEGNSVLLFVPDESADEATVHEEMLRTSAVDGLVLSDTRRDDARIEFLARRELPFVCFGRSELDPAHPWVDVDGAAGTAAAVEHLTARGHRRIAFLGSSNDFGFASDRRRGYERGLEAAEIGIDAALAVGVADDVEAAVASERLLAGENPPSAIVAATDALALGAYRGVRAAGAEVGAGGVGVVGFDDTPMAALVSPSLSSVHQPLDEAARVLVRLLAERIRGKSPDGVLLEPELVVRESS